uniref:Uncharacterized protein n=1 Tax=Siphoviridae sp. ct2u94 TaxID=2826277 RepID=A0A8S5QVG4_9CAUD|nr:MAG TPA: hypothetical protein [Siphoviridae sp. ct2u94]
MWIKAGTSAAPRRQSSPLLCVTGMKVGLFACLRLRYTMPAIASPFP